MMPLPLNRRRFITISGAAAGMGIYNSLGIASDQDVQMVSWQGAALGAKAQIKLYVDDPRQAQHVFDRCQTEITRLEKIFSLYRPQSEISLLNAHGFLNNPAFEFLELLSRCLHCYRVSDGAFDVTIQPLWKLYADHFTVAGADPLGPSEARIRQVLDYVGSDKIKISGRRISFEKMGMGISLNGVAQGYITDRVAKILKQAGFENLLVHMGETFANGIHADGRPWTAGISSPLPDRKMLMTVDLRNQALATSGGYGSPFSDQSRLHHLLDPKTGRSADHHGAVSVIARDTATADMLSTAFYVMPFNKVKDVWETYSQLGRAIFVDHVGNITEFNG